MAEDDELDEPEGEETAEAGDEPTATAAPQVETAEVGAEPAATDDEGTTVQAILEQTETGAPTAVPGRPGEVAQERIAVWSEEEAQRLRTEWRELQVQFIDEPAAAVAGAKRLVTEAVEQLSQSLLSQRDLLEPQSEHPDTEALRVAMRRYREFLDRVLAL